MQWKPLDGIVLPPPESRRREPFFVRYQHRAETSPPPILGVAEFPAAPRFASAQAYPTAHHRRHSFGRIFQTTGTVHCELNRGQGWLRGEENFARSGSLNPDRIAASGRDSGQPSFVGIAVASYARELTYHH
jgi:hypothetical protein